jgi:hypothetical protein
MSDEFNRISKSRDLMRSLYQSAKENLKFKPDATIALLKDEANAANPLGKTAYYDPANQKISLYTQGRHIKDVMRSLSHELVHHAQNCRGDFAGGIATVDGYAQEDGHLREMEREAYEKGNLIFRDWEDGIKSENNSLFTGKVSIGEKLMENNKMEITETKLREVIRGLVREMLISVKENIDDEDDVAKEDTARAAEESGEAASAAALGGATEQDDEADKPFQTQAEAKDPGGGDKADVEEEKEKEEMDESFFPTSHDIRGKARVQMNEALMKRWGYSKK